MQPLKPKHTRALAGSPAACALPATPAGSGGCPRPPLPLPLPLPLPPPSAVHAAAQPSPMLQLLGAPGSAASLGAPCLARGAAGPMQQPALLSLRSPCRLQQQQQQQPVLLGGLASGDALLAGTELSVACHMAPPAAPLPAAGSGLLQPCGPVCGSTGAGAEEDEDDTPDARPPPSWFPRRSLAAADPELVGHTISSVYAMGMRRGAGTAGVAGPCDTAGGRLPPQPVQGDAGQGAVNLDVPPALLQSPAPKPHPPPRAAVAPLRIMDVLQPSPSSSPLPRGCPGTGLDLNGVPYFSTFDVLRKSPGKY